MRRIVYHVIIPVRIVRALNGQKLERILSGSNFYGDLAKEFKKFGLSNPVVLAAVLKYPAKETVFQI